MRHKVILTDGNEALVNNDVLNGQYTIQAYGTFNSATIQIQFKLESEGANWTPITNSSLAAIDITAAIGFDIELKGYVRAIATSGTPTSVSIVFEGR
jgi:hypothetical protein